MNDTHKGTIENAEVRHIEPANPEYLEFSAFDEYKNELVGAFGVRGKDLATYSVLDPDDNLKKLCDELDIEFENVSRIDDQVHGVDTFVVTEGGERAVGYDALITDKVGVPLLIRVADCVAVLVYDPVKRVIGDIHAGWRGALRMIPKFTVEKMRAEYGCVPSDLICVLCPSIQQECFEVDEDVYADFVANFGEECGDVLGGGKYSVNVPYCVAKTLANAGVREENIHLSGICTMCNRELIHSYRGNIEGEKDYRNAAIICMK